MIKRSDSTSDWEVFDTTRAPNNLSGNIPMLYANTSGAEGGEAVDITANGFKVRTTGTYTNASGGTYIYAAFAEIPFGGSNVSPATAR